MKILIAGDLVINQTYRLENLDPQIVELFKHSDLNIVNLEAPITESRSKIIKTGPHLKGHEESTLQILKTLNIDIVTLANNHILDFDEKGVQDTLDFCKMHQIQSVGAGRNLEEASQTLFAESAMGKIAIVNFAENEWASATTNTAGANPMDIINNARQITAAKNNADFVLVIVHGGNEHYSYPSPRMVRQYRFYAECGANAVVGHHTHCISGYETYNSVPIFYSLGNFLFATQNQQRNSWYTGLTLQLEIQKGKATTFEIIPVSFTNDCYNLSVIDGESKGEIIHNISMINETIANDTLLQEKWLEFVNKNQKGYITTISPIAGIKNVYIRAALYRLKLHRIFLNKKYVNEFLNRIRCEAHYDVTKQILKHLIK